MANLGFTFDATQVAPNTGPSPLPADWYNGMITDSEIKPSKQKPQNHYLELTCKVMDGHYQGRTVKARINLWNDNPQASEIAQGELSAICHATGVYQVADSSRLHGIPLMFKVNEEPAKDGYDESNSIRGWAKLGEKESQNGKGVVLKPKAAATPTGPATAAAPAAGGAGYTPPWAAAAPAQPAPPAAQPAPPVAAPPAAAPPAPTFTPPPAPPVAAPVAAPGAGAPPTPPWVK